MCIRDVTAAHILDNGCHMGLDCMCRDVHGARDPFCPHYRKVDDYALEEA